MKNKKKIAFLASGNGGNLCFINKAITLGILKNYEIVSVICDRPCGAHNYARKHSIPSQIISINTIDQSELINSLETVSPDIIVTNIHRILNNVLVNKYQKKLLNLHYSLLPAFSGVIGMNSVTQAINYGAKFLGVTVHYVEEELDKGLPIAQISFPYDQTQNNQDTQNLIFRFGCLCLLTSLSSFGSDKLSVYSANIYSNSTLHQFTLSGGVLPQEFLQLDEFFWNSIKEEIL